MRTKALARRQDIVKQAKRKWLTPDAAAILMGFDLDESKLSPYIRPGGLIETRADGKLKLADVLAVADGRTLRQLLDKYLPIQRQKAPSRETTTRVLGSCTERESFTRKWHRVYRHVSQLLASPDEDFNWRELTLFHQLMQVSREVNRFELIVPTDKLMKITGLDDEYLPKTRRSLERRNILADGSPRDGTTARVYRFVDPLTGKPFDETLDDLPLDTSSSWLETSWPEW